MGKRFHHETPGQETIQERRAKQPKWHTGIDSRWFYDESMQLYVKEWQHKYYEQWFDPVRGPYWAVWWLEVCKPVNGWQREEWKWDYA